MIRFALGAFALALLMLPSVVRADDEKKSAIEKPAADEKSDEKGDTEEVALREVTHGALKLEIPESWKAAENPNRMRLATYKIPPAAEEGEDEAGKPNEADVDEIETELVISHFPGGGGGVEPNIARWIGQFDSKEREATIHRGVAPGDAEYYFVEVSGTYMKTEGGGPFSGGTKVPMDNYRVANVMLILPKEGVYFLKMTGPNDIVAANVAHLRKSFGAKKEDEKEVEL